MDSSIKTLFNTGLISTEMALTFASNPDRLGI
jgi:hypothetical protein